MKTIVAILFILGIGWALLAWSVVLLPIGTLMPGYRYQSHDTMFSLTGSALALIGYWIWFGWGFRWKTGRYPLVSNRIFWGVSFLIHLLWAFAIPFGYKETVVEFWKQGDALPFRSWIIINLAIAVTGFFIDSTRQSSKTEEAEQSDGGNSAALRVSS